MTPLWRGKGSWRRRVLEYLFLFLVNERFLGLLSLLSLLGHIHTDFFFFDCTSGANYVVAVADGK